MKMEKTLQIIYLTYYNLLIAQDLCPACCQILTIIFLKEFINLKVSMGTVCDCLFEYTIFKGVLIE